MKVRNLLIVLVCLVLANVLVQMRVFRWDLTDDKIYSLSEASKNLLRQTDAPIEVTLLLDGDLNAGFRRLKKATEETLEEMAVYGDLQVKTATLPDDSLAKLHTNPTVILEREHNGKTAQTMIYPYAIMTYKNKFTVVPLLKNAMGLSGEENLNTSIEQLEYAFAEALHRLQQVQVPKIAFLEGHGELDDAHTYDLMAALSIYFQVDRGAINGEEIDLHVLDDYKVLIIADPWEPFSDAELFVLDQYIMRGGSILWAVNGVQFSDEALQESGRTPIIEHNVGIKEMFYRYGVSIDPVLMQDIQCMTTLVNVSDEEEEPNLQPIPWTFAPLLQPNTLHPVGKGLGPVMSSFVSPTRPVNQNPDIAEYELLTTSTNTKSTSAPNEVDLADFNQDWSTFVHAKAPVAIALEGRFPSMYAHRMVPDGVITNEPIVKTGEKARQVVIGSGSILRNEIQQRQVVPLGYDRYRGIQYSNRDFIVNAVLWLADNEGLISLRSKTVPLRLLNTKRAYDERTKVELVSTICPVVILMLLGGVIWIIRKRRYEK